MQALLEYKNKLVVRACTKGNIQVLRELVPFSDAFDGQCSIDLDHCLATARKHLHPECITYLEQTSEILQAVERRRANRLNEHRRQKTVVAGDDVLERE